MAAPLTITQAADLVDRSIQDIFIKETNIEKKKIYPQYVNVVTGVTDYYMKDSSLSGFGQASRITENAVFRQEAPVQGYDKTYEQFSYGLIGSFSKKMWKFGIKKRDLERVTRSLVSAVNRRIEQLCADRLDNAFATSYTVTDDNGNYTATISGGDSAAFITNSHTREDGGTAWGNRVTDGTTVNMDFDYDAIKAAHQTAAQIRDPKGQLMNINLDTIVVRKGFTNAFRAKEILGAIRSGGKSSLPASAQNDAAGVPAYEVVEVPYITTNTSYWFMFDSSMKNDEFGLQYKESQPITLEGPNIVFKTKEIQYSAEGMFDIGHNDARPWVGSKNTNAA